MWQAIVAAALVCALLTLWIDRRRQVAIMRASIRVEQAERRADELQEQLDAEVETRKREIGLKFADAIQTEERLGRAIVVVDKLLRALHVCAANLPDERSRLLAVKIEELREYINVRQLLSDDARWLL